MDEKTYSRLEIVVGYANRIAQTRARAQSRDGFLADYDLQYSVAHSISQIAETLTQVLQATPELSSALLELVPYRDIRRMRDKIQHHYGTIDPDIVWDISGQNIPKLKAAIEQLLADSK
ncbi:MAG: DUF86 domain-containing protein [Actinomycetes bacterium]|jgi:uncharacterized protein with HEPN domain|nr:DUF86 domain-containing protein [Actinomycetes bacterium]